MFCDIKVYIPVPFSFKIGTNSSEKHSLILEQADRRISGHCSGWRNWQAALSGRQLEAGHEWIGRLTCPQLVLLPA